MHGWINGPPDGSTKIGHAWLERDGYVYDVVGDDLLTVERHRDHFGAQPLARWQHRNAARMLSDAKRPRRRPWSIS